MKQCARFLLVLLLASALPGSAARGGAGIQKTETVDCIVAAVGSRIITLTDVKIVEAFGILDTADESDAAKRRHRIVEKLIDQKVVVELARENVPVDAARVEKAWTDILSRLGRDEARRRLAEFGAEPVDLLPYLEEKLLAEAVIDRRFSHRAPVSIKEIESFYAETYEPERKALGLPVPPLIEVVDEIENRIRNATLADQTAQWIRNLRGQTEIEVRADCLMAPRSPDARSGASPVGAPPIKKGPPTAMLAYGRSLRRSPSQELTKFPPYPIVRLWIASYE